MLEDGKDNKDLPDFLCHLLIILTVCFCDVVDCASLWDFMISFPNGNLWDWQMKLIRSAKICSSFNGQLKLDPYVSQPPRLQCWNTQVIGI